MKRLETKQPYDTNILLISPLNVWYVTLIWSDGVARVESSGRADVTS